MYLEFLPSLIKKHPSADVNPANQFGSMISGVVTKGLSTDTTLGKAKTNFDERPRFCLTFIDTIFFNLSQSDVRCF